MRTLNIVPVLVRGAIAAFLVVMALSGPAGFRYEPRNAEAIFLAEVKKLTASDAQGQDEFGYSVAINGDTAMVGAIQFYSGTTDTGAVYVFERDDGGADNWGEVKKLVASDGDTFDQFGGSVAVSVDTAVVGASRDDDGGGDAGAAYVFERGEGGAGNWGEVKKLIASDAEASDFFGFNVSISGDTVIVGAFAEDSENSNAGAAYVFERDQGGPNNWGEVKKLTASVPGFNHNFGGGVAVSGDTAFVGASGGSAAFVFQRDEGGANNWGEVKRLTTGNPPSGGIAFGTTVALDGDSGVVGATLGDTGGANAGAAYVFERDQGGIGNWGEVKKLLPADIQTQDHFGSSVEISGDTAIVGAENEDAAGGNAGAAYMFGRDHGGANNWGQLEKLTASDAGTGDEFGYSASVSGSTAFVGAHENGGGAAYLFGPVGPGDADQDGCTDKAENGSNENFGGERDDAYFWDFFDVWTHPPGDPIGWERNKVLNIFDINGVGARFGPGPVLSKADALAQALVPPTDESSYHPAFDRGAIIGANDWDRAPADGSINIVDDILGVAAQFGHNCS